MNAHAVAQSGPRRRSPRLLPGVVAAAIATLALGACGNAAPARTIDNEPDLASITRGVIPAGLRSSTTTELRLLRAACGAIDTKVGAELPDVAREGAVTHLALEDGQCEWTATATDSVAPGPPELIVGIIDGGGARLDETAAVLSDERSVSGVGDRAIFDPQTRTLYSVRHDRLWYVQLVGTGPVGSTAAAIVTNVGRALMRTSASS